MPEPWEARFNELDVEVLAVQTMFEGTNWALGAVALALIDAGAIDRERLIDIIESLRAHLQADAYGNLGDVQDAELALDSLAAWISGSEWREGAVVEDLRQRETAALARLLQRSGRTQRRKD